MIDNTSFYLPVLFDNAPKCVVKRSPIHKNGLFPHSQILKGEIVIDFSDRENFVEVNFASLSDDFLAEGHLLGLSEQKCLIAKTPSKFAFVNHSRNPNCLVDFSKRLVYAKRAISAGEELTLDYRLEPAPPRVSALIAAYV